MWKQKDREFLEEESQVTQTQIRSLIKEVGGTFSAAIPFLCLQCIS